MWRDRDKKEAGAEGRYIQDDPRKYPSKENMGLFSKLLWCMLLHSLCVHLRCIFAVRH